LCRFYRRGADKASFQRGDEAIGVDNLNDYYDVQLKKDRLAQLQPERNFHFTKLDISAREELAAFFREQRPERVAHLAAQAGVRYSLEDPYAYVDANLVGFMNILEGCRHNDVEHLVYASSSSVYGANTKMPFSESDSVDHPLSLYGATKKANELMAHAYSHLYRLPTTGLRFFTVYDPWGRPDMALFLFTRKILAGEPIAIFNNGNHQRDFTYIDDIVEGVTRVVDTAAADENRSGSAPGPATSLSPCRIYNIGNHQPVELMDFIRILEDCLGRKAKKNFLPMQPGDVIATYADVDDLIRAVAYSPATPVERGIEAFVHWYKSYYKAQ